MGTTLNAFMLPFLIQALYRLMEEIHRDNVLPDNKEEIEQYNKEEVRKETGKLIKLYENETNDFFKGVIYRKMRTEGIVKFNNGRVNVIRTQAFKRRMSEGIGCNI